MVSIGKLLGKRMRALITRMDQPLGLAVGNAVEKRTLSDCHRDRGGQRAWRALGRTCPSGREMHSWDARKGNSGGVLRPPLGAGVGDVKI